MEYEKIINLLENTPNQPSKSRTTVILNLKLQCLSQVYAL